MPTKEISVKEITEKKPEGKEELDFLTELRHKVLTDQDDRQIWESKIIAAENQRMGIKKITNFPYEDAPNIPLPETDKLIKKAIPNLVLSSWAQKKMCTVNVQQGVQETPEMKQKAQKTELVMNMLLRTKMDLFRKLELAADYAKAKGHCVFRIIEEFKSRQVHKVIDLSAYPQQQVEQLKKLPRKQLKMFIDRRYNLDYEDPQDKKTCEDIVDQLKSGKEIVDFTVEEITSFPNIEVPLPTKIIVPGYVTDINKSPRVTYEYFLTRYEIEEKMEQGTFIKKDMDKLEFGTSNVSSHRDIVEQSKGWNEGIEDNTSLKDVYRIHEICTKYKPEKNRPAQRMVYTFFADIADVEDAMLQKIEFPFEFEGWNYEKYDNEVKDERYHNSRGVPEQIRAIQEFMERSLNNALIRDEYNNNPTYEVTDTSDYLDTHDHFVPGELIPVKALGTEIRRINDPLTVDVSSERLMQMLKAYAEEYLGNVDQLFRNATNVGGGKTLGEIQVGMRAASGQLNVEVIRWNEILSKVYTKIFNVMAERLGDSIWVNGIEVTKEDFNFPAEVKSNGQLEVADADLSAQKALMRVQLLLNPALQDIVNSEDRYNALKDWLEKDGVKNPDDFSTNPMEIAATQIKQMQGMVQQLGGQAQQLQQANERAFINLQEAKQSTVKEQIKDLVTFQKELDNAQKTATTGRR